MPPKTIEFYAHRGEHGRTGAIRIEIDGDLLSADARKLWHCITSTVYAGRGDDSMLLVADLRTRAERRGGPASDDVRQMYGAAIDDEHDALQWRFGTLYLANPGTPESDAARAAGWLEQTAMQISGAGYDINNMRGVFSRVTEGEEVNA